MSAQVTARASGEPVEDLSASTASERVFAGNGHACLSKGTFFETEALTSESVIHPRRDVEGTAVRASVSEANRAVVDASVQGVQIRMSARRTRERGLPSGVVLVAARGAIQAAFSRMSPHIAFRSCSGRLVP